MEIGENVVAFRITRHRHREGIFKNQINILTPLMNMKEKNDAPLLHCVEWDCTNSFCGKAAWKSIHFSSTIDRMHAKTVKGEQGTNWFPLSRRRLYYILFFTISNIEIELEMA